MLIMNADDLGFTDGVTRGIGEAYRAGTVTSASLMVTTSGFVGALDLIRSSPDLGVGLHINLTVGRPVAPLARVPSLIDQRTLRFRSLAQLAARAFIATLPTSAVRIEVEAHFARARDAGVLLTHVDGHQHVHLLPGIAPIVREVAHRFGVPFIRQPVESLTHRPWRIRATLVKGALKLAHRRSGGSAIAPVSQLRGISLQGGGAFGDRLHADLLRLPEGVTEMIVHPGHVDRELEAIDDYLLPREIELRALTHPDLAPFLRSLPLRLANFATR